MTEPSHEPQPHPSDALEGDLGTVTDDEYFHALPRTPALVDDDGTEYDPAADVRDLRHLDPPERDAVRRQLDAETR